ncbi:hypothetical protein TNIN_184561 [Trichonephila inaurata madagascariensis]|uniref:Uncharacterized protein n=1 Tax=Trichonephila inaurata madagascariensis TaxID=2747483 RepID=A0A8X6YMM4_9ARAC|nr:hypothetical protein TNIN_184561 [Trichonephila inaurata madagascariensis]
MPWPKIHRWRLFVTRIDHRPVASLQSGQSILHSATSFELPLVHAVLGALRLRVAHSAISCRRYVSRCHLSFLTPVAYIVCFRPQAAR